MTILIFAHGSQTEQTFLHLVFSKHQQKRVGREYRDIPRQSTVLTTQQMVRGGLTLTLHVSSGHVTTASVLTGVLVRSKR